MKTITLVLCTLTATTLTNSYAQDTSLVDTMLTQLQEVEVKGVRVGSKAPFSITNVSKANIMNANHGQDLPYILEQTPSIIVNSDAGTGIGYTDMRIRGTDNQRINFTINGVPVNDPESHGTFFVNFPDLMSTASSVQIQRGVGSSTNGSGAFGASVHINNLSQSSVPYLTAINGIGSYNTKRHSIMAGTGLLPKGFAFDVRLSKLASDGYIDRSYADLKSLHFLGGWQSNDNKTQVKFNLFTGKERTGQAWNGVSEEMMKTNRRYNELGIMDDGTFYNDQSDNYQQDYYQLFINHRWNNHWSTNAALFYTRGKGYYNEYRLKQDFSDYGLNSFVLGNDTIDKTSLIRQLWLDNHYYGALLSTTYQNHNTRVDAGLSINNYDAAHYGIVKWAAIGIPADHKWYDNPADKQDINSYIKWEQQIAKGFYTFVDMQLRSVQYNIYGFRKNAAITGHHKYLFFNPKAGITYLKNQNKYFLSYARAAKEPNRNDFEAGVQQVPSHEVLNDIELGYERTGRHYHIGINLYWMQYQNQLIYTGKINDVGAYTRINVPHSYRRGIELYGSYRIIPKLLWHAGLTLSQNKIQSYTEYIDNYDLGTQEATVLNNTHIALSPGFIANSQLKYDAYTFTQGSKITLEWNSKAIGRQYLDNTSATNKSIAPYHVHNLVIGFDIHNKLTNGMRLSFITNNIFNKSYESKGYTYSYVYDNSLSVNNYYYPQAGRNYMLNLTIDL